MNRIITIAGAIGVAVFTTTAFASGGVDIAEIREALEMQIREHQSAIDSLQSQVDSIRLTEKRQEAAKRQKEMEKYLKSVFPVDSLTLGEAEIQVNCCREQYGIYVGGRHLRDVYSNGHEFTKYELTDSVCLVLKVARVIDSSFSFVTPSISPEADSLLRSWGGGISGILLDYGNPREVLVMGANSKSVSIMSSGSVVTIDIANHDGPRTITTVVNGEVIGRREIPQP